MLFAQITFIPVKYIEKEKKRKREKDHQWNTFFIHFIISGNLHHHSHPVFHPHLYLYRPCHHHKRKKCSTFLTNYHVKLLIRGYNSHHA